MNLYLTGRSFLNAEYTNDEGEAMYRVQTPYKYGLVAKTTTISRVIDSDPGTSNDDSLHGRFGHLAQIDWKIANHSKIRYKGQEIGMKEFFRRPGWSGLTWIFTALDGKEYKWILGPSVPSLVLNDGSNTKVAKFRRKGLFSKKPSYLEIFEGGTHMVDEIFVLFIYIEKMRLQRRSNS